MSKRMDEANKLVEAGKLYDAKEAIDLALKMPKAKFDETVEMHIKLGVDSKQADQQVRGVIVLPNGTGKSKKVLVIAKGDKADAAREAGADFVGDDDMIQKIQKENWFGFDVVVATPDMMASLGRIAKLLGPKGLMPNPKSGTVTMDVAKAVSEIKAGKIEYRLEELKQDIQSESNIIEMQEEINEYGKFEDLLDKIKFEVVPNIRLNNIYKSLEILTLDGEGRELNNIGDGKNKIFSMLLKSKIYSNEKKKIYLVEEPENHLYVLLQKYYIEALKSLNPDQLIITTHSPYIVDFEKTNQIIKLDYNVKDNTRRILKYNINNDEFKKLGYLINSEVAEMLYYNNVLLVEGESEKYFYNLLLIKDINFHKYIFENRFGIFAVNGIAFEMIKKLLEALGVNVFIKTDNDIFKVQNTEETYRYAGLERCIKYLNEQSKEKIKQLLGWDNLNKERFRFDGENAKIKIIEEKISDIANIMRENNILISIHNDGFEKDFLDYIEYPQDKYKEAFEYLKKAKLKNLHEFICENDIDISINDNNKNSILLGFMNE